TPLHSLGHDARLMPAKYVKPYRKGQKNDFRDAEAIAEAVQRPTMKFVATKTADQLDLQALVACASAWSASVPPSSTRSVPTCWSVALRSAKDCASYGPGSQRSSSKRTDVLSDRMVHVIEDLAADWRRLDERIQGLSGEIEIVASQDPGQQRRR